MGKRSSRPDHGSEAYRKRQKITHDVPTGEPVSSSDQLRKLLAFDQDLHRARYGLQSFKLLLDDAVSDSDDRHAKLAILKEYLDSVKPRHADEEDHDDDDYEKKNGDRVVFLNDIMEMWSFASQTNNDGVMSSVAVVLALVLQAVSTSLELVPHGLGICRTLLQERQLKSLSKNLSAEKNKGFILSPTLRMLKEAVCLDGGAYAKRIFRARHSTFASLGRNMEIGPTENTAEDSRKTSVRTNAVRFFLSCLKYLHSDGRRELMSQRDLMSHLTFMIRGDPYYLVLDILDHLKKYALADSKIPRDVKFRNFNTKTLQRFLALYSYSVPSAEETSAVVDASHEFLLHICTTSSAGVLYPASGLYPKETENDTFLNHPSNDGSYTSNKDAPPIYNFVLSEFARKLRPWSNLKHSELLTAIFRAAPELVADYFRNNQSFTFEPKLSMTWIGYAAFLFNTMMIPLPPYFGDRSRFNKGPPPISILLDNVIPLPINQKVLVRCLSPKSNLTSFFAARILVIAMEKLASAIQMLQGPLSSSRDGSKWTEAVRQLVDGFCQRVPDMKEVVRSYKSIPAENHVHKTIASRLIALYYEVIPQVAVAANFDVSPSLVQVLQKNGDDNQEGSSAFNDLELQNLVNITSYSPGMRWFASIDKLSHGSSSSPFTALLRLLCDSSRAAPLEQLSRVLNHVAVENQLVSKETGLEPLTRALKSVNREVDDEQKPVIWSFLDNCINRCGKSPLKYHEQAKAMMETSSSDHLDFRVQALLTFVLMEQLHFVTSSATKAEKKALAKFLSLYLNALFLSREGDDVLKKVHSNISKQLGDSKNFGRLGKVSELERLQEISVISYKDEEAPTRDSQTKTSLMDQEGLKELLHVPVDRDPDTSVLTRWSSKDIEDLIDDDWIIRLVNLLSSPHPHIRKEAYTSILHLTAKLKASTHDDKDQLWLLLSELAESTRSVLHSPSTTNAATSPVPSPFIAFTKHAIPILLSPLHPLYEKVNDFMTRDPSWPLHKLPMAHSILHSKPSQDDKYYTELSFLLSYLLDALITPQDLSTFHKKRWLEKIFGLMSNPFLRQNLKSKILRIVYRCTEIEGGCEVLVKRFGALSWLDELAQGETIEDEDEKALIEALMVRIWEKCNKQEIDRWSHGGIGRLMEGVVRGRKGANDKPAPVRLVVSEATESA